MAPPPDPAAPARPRRTPAVSRAWAWLGVALWVGLALAVVRAAALLAMERAAHGMGAELARMRLAAVLPELVGRGAALGLAATAVAALAGAAAGPRARWGRALAALAIAVACAAFWTGRLQDDVTRRIGADTGRGRQATAALAAAAVVAGGATVALARRAAAPRRPAGPLRAAAPAALAAALAGGAPALLGAAAPRMPIREVVRDLLEREPAWDALHAHPAGAARVAVLCPSEDFRVRGGDLPALVLPPPGEARFTVDAADAPAALELRVGFDGALVGDPALAGHGVRFTVAVDGATAFETVVPIEQVGEKPGAEWRDAPALPLVAGARVALATALIGPDGEPVPAGAIPRALDAGFGGMKLVRVLTRARERATPTTPNVILIVMDTLRADRTSAYGYSRPTTPHLERLAARGLRYANATSASSWTWPSTASILTGLHPLEHGVQDEASCHLAESLVSLPEALQRRGWTTAAWSANLLIVPDKGFAQGFEHFEHAVGASMESRQLMPAALEWIAAQGDDRFFLYLQMLDPHSPLEPLPDARALLAPEVPPDFSKWAIEDYKWDLIGNCAYARDPAAPDVGACVPAEHQRWISDLYDACIRSGDRWLGDLLDRLDALGRTDDTVVIFTSDHGEEMFEHGQLSHSQCLYQGSVRVPLVLAGPGIPAGEVVEERVANRHLAATIARICGAPWTTTPDALDLARPRSIEARDVLVTTRQGWWNGVYRQPLLALLRGEHALHLAPEGGAFGAPPEARTGDWALFDLTRSPEVRVAPDGAAEALAADLRSELERRAEELRARRATRALGAGGSTLEMLKGIGYLGDE